MVLVCGSRCTVVIVMASAYTSQVRVISINFGALVIFPRGQSLQLKTTYSVLYQLAEDFLKKQLSLCSRKLPHVFPHFIRNSLSQITYPWPISGWVSQRISPQGLGLSKHFAWNVQNIFNCPDKMDYRNGCQEGVAGWDQMMRYSLCGKFSFFETFWGFLILK